MIEELFKLISETYGIAGLIMASPFLGCLILWRKIESMHREQEKTHREYGGKLQVLNDRLVDSQKERVGDAQAISTKLVEIVTEQTSLNKETNHALDRLGDMVSVLVERR